MTNNNVTWKWLIAFREVNRETRHFHPAQVAVLFSLATRANPDGTGIYRGTRETAADVGVDPKTVTVALRAAREKGVMCRHRGERGGMSRDVYQLTDQATWTLAKAKAVKGELLPY